MKSIKLHILSAIILGIMAPLAADEITGTVLNAQQEAVSGCIVSLSQIEAVDTKRVDYLNQYSNLDKFLFYS